MRALRLRIADVAFAMETRDPNMTLEVPEPAAPFLVEPDARSEVGSTHPDLRVEARYDDLEGFDGHSLGRLVFDSAGTWRLFDRGDVLCFVFHSHAFGPAPYKIAFVGRNMDRVDVRLHRAYFPSDEPRYPLEHPLDELLMLNVLARRGGIEVHSSGIVDRDGEGRLFVGMSGAGKTTISRLWMERRPVTILSDDRIVLRRHEGRIWMHGTPWHGEGRLSAPERAPLQHIYFLRHGLENRAVPLVGASAVARLMACTFAPFHSADGIAAAMAFHAELLGSVPVSELTFLPDTRVIDILAAPHVAQEER